MSKKQRKTSKGRNNKDFDFEDDDTIDTCYQCNSPRNPCNCDPEESAPAVRPAYQPRSAQKHDFKEGQVVVTPDKRKIKSNEKIGQIIGTIIMVCGGELHILDTDGVIHNAVVSEVYYPQK